MVGELVVALLLVFVGVRLHRRFRRWWAKAFVWGSVISMLFMMYVLGLKGILLFLWMMFLSVAVVLIPMTLIIGFLLFVGAVLKKGADMA